MNAKCPYCNLQLDKLPTRKKKCPNCENDIYVRKGQLLTKKDSIFIDAKANLLGMGLKGVGTAKNTDDLWRILNENILTYSQKGDLHTISSIYLQMAVICFDEDRYKDCIHNYLLCSHFSALNEIRDHKKYGMELKFSDLLNRDNYMMATPVISSIEELGIEGMDTNNLGILAVNPKLTLDEKIEILREAFEGKTERLMGLSDIDEVLVKEKAYLEPTTVRVSIPKKKNTGCLGVFIGITLIILLILK